MYYNASTKIDLFIATTKREYESICGPNYGFDDGVVVRTGIARYDRLNDFKTKKADSLDAYVEADYNNSFI